MAIYNDLNDILSSFTNKLVDINNYQSFIKSSTKRSIEFYDDQMKKAKEYNIDFKPDLNRLMCTSIEDGSMIFLGHNDNSYEDLMNTVFLHNNKQYQWLLVEAYEAFEDFINDLYAYMGYKDNTFWIAKDFGNISIDELYSKDQNWFRDRVKEKQGTPESIYKQLRSKIATVKLLEKKNPQNREYDFLIVLISKLRHVIVHNRGEFKDLDKFVELVLKDIGLSMNAKNAKQYKSHISFYVGKYNIDKFVLLLEYDHKKDEKNPFRSYTDRLGGLIEALASYAILLKSFCEKYLSNNEVLKKLVTDEKAYMEFYSLSDLYKHLREKDEKNGTEKIIMSGKREQTMGEEKIDE